MIPFGALRCEVEGGGCRVNGWFVLRPKVEKGKNLKYIIVLSFGSGCFC